jgi:hypothetical protein
MFAACAVETPSDSTQVTSNLEQTDGGYTTADEAPMFGAEAEFDTAAIETDTPVTDVMASDPTVTSLDAAGPTAVDGRDVVLLWGRIPGDPLAKDGRDWSGTLTMSSGAIVVKRTIAFEQNDHLLPRTTPGSVAFVSYTRPYADGLALRVLSPLTPAATPEILTYTSTPPAGSTIPSVSYQFDLAQLAAGPIVVDAGDGFKMIAVAQHKHDNDGCVGGFMRGRFHALTANVGVYHGLVLNRLGEPVGHIRGIYGHRKNGDAVMFGKFIDRQGKFMGVLAGTYGSGELAAHWKEVGDEDHGRIHGKYFESSAADGGVFVARWAQTACSEDQD